MARTLDKNKPFGQVCGGGEAFYEQDGCLFDIDGNIIGDEPAEAPKKRGPKPQDPNSASSATFLDAQIEANLKG